MLPHDWSYDYLSIVSEMIQYLLLLTDGVLSIFNDNPPRSLFT